MVSIVNTPCSLDCCTWYLLDELNRLAPANHKQTYSNSIYYTVYTQGPCLHNTHAVANLHQWLIRSREGPWEAFPRECRHQCNNSTFYSPCTTCIITKPNRIAVNQASCFSCSSSQVFSWQPCNSFRRATCTWMREQVRAREEGKQGSAAATVYPTSWMCVFCSRAMVWARAKTPFEPLLENAAWWIQLILGLNFTLLCNYMEGVCVVFPADVIGVRC